MPIHKQFLVNMNKKSPDLDGSFLISDIDIMLTQMIAKAGNKYCEEKSTAAIFKEFKQLYHIAMPDKPVFGLVDNDKITKN